uniref:Olfactory receptor 8 n=1 Tax=Meteorus pulchricornis TaxID=51522 RepID=A0A1S5VFK0_9HYME|nr:olfactory receptor 8 [Meteorus pulchricornis]
MIAMNTFKSKVEVTKQTRYIFSILGIWPMMTNNTTIIKKRVSAVMRLVCQSLLAFIIIPGLIQFYLLENLEIKLAYVAPFGIVIACAFKFTAIVNRRKEIKKCVTQIEQDWREISNENENAVMLDNFKKGERITTVCASVMYYGGISHQIMMPFLPGSIASIFDNTTKRLLVYPTNDMMFNSQITPVYEILYITHIVIGILICTILVGSCHLAILFICHILGQNQTMILKLANLTDEQVDDERKVNQRFTEIIHLHHKILEYVVDWFAIYKYIKYF